MGAVLIDMWTLNQAQELFRITKYRLDQLYHAVGIYGSVIREGKGNDLDLTLIQMRNCPPVNSIEAVRLVAQELNAQVVHYTVRCSTRISFILMSEHGRIDLVLCTISDIRDYLGVFPTGILPVVPDSGEYGTP